MCSPTKQKTNKKPQTITVTTEALNYPGTIALRSFPFGRTYIPNLVPI